MKRNQIRRLILWLIGLGVGVVTGAEGGGESKSSTQPGVLDVRLAAQPGEQRLHDYLNRPVLGIAGTNIGTVEEFLVDRTSGRLAYVVVSVPDAPLHERRRLLRGDALRWQPGSASFEVEAAAELPADDSTRLLQGDTFLRATSLPGQSVRNGNRVIGRITDVVIDLGTRAAAIVLTPSPIVMKTRRTFVVSMSRLRVGSADSKVAMTTMTPEDLARAELAATPIAVDGSLPVSPITGASGIAQSSVSGQTGYSTSQTATAATTEATDGGVINESPTPTGRLEHVHVPPGWSASPVMITPGQSPREADAKLKAQIERALATDPRFLGEDITVSVQRGVVTLRGKLGSTLKQTAAIGIAREAGARVVKPEFEAGPPR